METQQIWKDHSNELFFFILKKVKDKVIAKDILQNTFLKIHSNLASVKHEKKLRAWSFQIARNEIANYFNNESVYVEKFNTKEEIASSDYKELCCFDTFINDLPESYRTVVELVYIKGKKQKEASEVLGISLENTKARLRRAKAMLKLKFNECCRFELDNKGKLVGESNCPKCGKD